MGSRVEVVDLRDSSVLDVTLTLPDDSDPGNGLLSVLSPLGSALLGAKSGEIVDMFVVHRLTRLRVVGLEH